MSLIAPAIPMAQVIPDIEKLYVDGFNSLLEEWDETGASPWLDDDITSELSTNIDNEEHLEFTYAEHSGFEIINSVTFYIELKGPSARKDRVECLIQFQDGGAWLEVLSQDPDADDYAWYSADISGYANTWAKINYVKLKIRYKKSGSPKTQILYARRSYIEIDFEQAQVQEAEGDYTDEHWDTSVQSGNPYGITTDGSNIWLVDWSDDEVYKYNMTGFYTGEHWDTSGQGGTPYGITTNGSNIWLVDGALDKVYKYTMAGGYIDSWDTTGYPYGITTDNSNIWVLDQSGEEVYKYTMAGVYVDSWDTSGQVGTFPSGITTDGSNIWIVNYGDDEVYKYTMAGVYVDSWDTSGQSALPVGIATDGINIWVLEYTGKEVYKYEGPPAPEIYPPSDPNLLFGAGFNASSPYVELHWNHSLVDVQFFEVQNSSDGESWTYLGQSTTANYTDTQVANGTERYYKVRACNQTEGSWYNSSFSDVNFDMVYFIMAVADGEAPPVEDYSIIFLAIGLILMLSIAFLYVKTR